jgi:hypothetical protein
MPLALKTHIIATMGRLNKKLTDEILSKVEELANEKYAEDLLETPLPPRVQSSFFTSHNTFFGRYTLNDRLLQKFRSFIISKAELNHQEKELIISGFQKSLNTAESSAFFLTIFQENTDLFFLDTAPVSITMERGSSFET